MAKGVESGGERWMMVESSGRKWRTVEVENGGGNGRWGKVAERERRVVESGGSSGGSG